MYNLKSLQEWAKVSQTLGVLPSSSTAPSHYILPQHLNITKQKQHNENEIERIKAESNLVSGSGGSEEEILWKIVSGEGIDVSYCQNDEQKIDKQRESLHPFCSFD